MRPNLRKFVLPATLALAVCAAYWWTRSEREAQPGARSPPAPAVAISQEWRQSGPESLTARLPVEPELVAPQGRRAEPGARHAQNAPAAEQTTDPELIEAEEQARLQATRFELGSMLDTQPVDRDFRDRAQAEIDTAMEKLGSTAVQLLSVDCRRTLCQLELSSSDAAAMADFLENFPAALGWSTDLRMDTRESPGNGVVTTLFMTRDGVAMPAIAAEQR